MIIGKYSEPFRSEVRGEGVFVGGPVVPFCPFLLGVQTLNPKP